MLPGIPEAQALPPTAGWLPGTRSGEELAALRPYFAVVLAQTLTLVTQLVLTFLLTRKRMLVRLINAAISSLEASLNRRINEQMRASVASLLDGAFDTVRARVDQLEPILTATITKAETLLESAASVERLADAAEGARSKVEEAATAGADRMRAMVGDATTKQQASRDDMQARIERAAEVVGGIKGSAAMLAAAKEALGGGGCGGAPPPAEA